MILDILVELMHTIHLLNNNTKPTLLRALQSAVGTTTRFSDVCTNSSDNNKYQSEHLDKAEISAISEYSDNIKDLRKKITNQ